MAGVNKIILIGHLGRDPEMKYGQTSSVPVTRFSLATTERRNGEDRTEWHNVVCFNKTAEFANEYLSKGRQVYVEGRVQTRKWQDKAGQDRYTAEVIANTVQALGSNPSKTSGNSPAPASNNSTATVYRDEKDRPATSRTAQNEDLFKNGQTPGRRPTGDPFSEDFLNGEFGPSLTDLTDDDMPF